MGCAASRDLFAPDYLAEARPDGTATVTIGSDKGALKKTVALIDKLGGREAVDAAVELFYGKVMADDRINYFFEGVDMRNQKLKQCAFLAAAFGGSTPYKGRDMYECHKHLRLNEEHFNIVADHMAATLRQLRVPPSIINEAMAVVATTKLQVLGQEDAAGNPVVRAPTVYEQIGGREALEAAVDLFYSKVNADGQLGPCFAAADMRTHKAQALQAWCHTLGGSERYRGPALYELYASLGVGPAQWDALMAHAAASLRLLRVPQDVVDAAVAKLGEARY